MRRRLVQLAVAAAVLAVALFGLPLAVAIGQYATAHELRDLERLAEATSLVAAADLYEGDIPRGVPDKAGDVDIAVYGGDGVLILGSGPCRARPARPGGR